MSNQRTAQILGDHVALTSVEAITWRRVCTGELTPEAAAEQLGCSEDERERARLIFGPPTPVERQRQLDALLARFDASLPPARPRWRGWGVIALVLPAAAAVAAAVLLTTWTSEQSVEVSALSMDYTAEPPQGIAMARSPATDSGPPTFLPSTPLKLVLRPEDVIEGPIEVVGFARESTGPARRLTIQPHVLPSGVVEIDTPVRDAGLVAGEWTLVLVVGRPGSLPSSWEELERSEAGEGPDRFEVVRLPKIRVIERTEP
jgi:hypothetical protein